MNASNIMKFPISLENICTCNSNNDNILEFETDFTSGEIHMCSLAGNCSISNMFNTLAIESQKLDFTAGASKKNDKKKDDKTSNFDRKQDLLKKLADYLCKLFTKSPNAYTESDIRNLLMNANIDGTKNVLLSTDDLHNVISLASTFYKSKVVDHPLFSIKNDNVQDLFQQLKHLDDVSTVCDYENFLKCMKIRASEYVDITSCTVNNSLYFNRNETPIPSIIFALFAVRLPIFFDLVTNQDLYMLQKEMQTDNYSYYENIILLLFRLSDPDPFYNISGHGTSKSTFYNELSRIAISMSLKQVIYGLLGGKVTSNITNTISKLSNKYKIQNTRSEQEAALASIFKVWSFMPTVVLKSSLFQMTDPRPETVFYVELNLYDVMRADSSINLKFGKDMLNYLYYDQASNKVALYPFANRNMNLPMNINCMPNQLMNYGNPYSYSNVGPITLKSIGVFVLSIPRVASTTSFLSNSYPNEYGGQLSSKYIDIETNITIADKLFTLTSAVCYKSNTNYSSSCVGSEIAMGTIAVVRTQKGWIKYDKDVMIGCSSQSDLLDKMLMSEYRKRTDSYELIPEDYTEWKRDIKNIQHVIERYEKGYIDIDALLINESEAMDLITRYGTIIIYAEDVSTNFANNFIPSRGYI